MKNIRFQCYATRARTQLHATPENYRIKRLSFSPEVLKTNGGWRSRASQNGIRVDDDEDDSDADTSYASENIPYTPPRNLHLAAHLRLKGSVTAPAHERRTKSNVQIVDERIEPEASLALLSPCTHALCPACLTSAVNIVDKLSVHCVVCRATPPLASSAPLRPTPSTRASCYPSRPPPNVPLANTGIFNNKAIDPNKRLEKLSRATFRSSSVLDRPCTICVVLRIDNVPWEITPPAILAFLGARAHVLLDRLEKTPTEAVARAVPPPSSAPAAVPAPSPSHAPPSSWPPSSPPGRRLRRPRALRLV
ncbi:hypothetical protein C8R47DRAFT_1314013 [Mycena vitilis]|nr:hypothetical protein C8R47DRAFT_1314013 [Mycena vitilis]